MRAIQIQSHGRLEALTVVTLPDPTPAADEVLVRIKASAVNPLDGIIRMGDFPIAKKPPLILGEEAAGVVERNGAGFNAGERVIVYGGGLGGVSRWDVGGAGRGTGVIAAAVGGRHLVRGRSGIDQCRRDRLWGTSYG
jgi:NADPH:quinone reductase-like Zn-dependent oxidoreductase